MKVLLLGGTGLIRTAITRHLLERGHTVTHLNRGRTSAEFTSRVALIKGDRNSTADLAEAVHVSGADTVVDMMCYTIAGSELMTWNGYWHEVARAAGAPEPAFTHIPTDALYRADPALAEWCCTNFQYNNVFDCSAAARDLRFQPPPQLAGRTAPNGLVRRAQTRRRACCPI